MSWELYQLQPHTASRWYSLSQAEHAAGFIATGRVPPSWQLGAWAPSAQHALRPARTTRPTMPYGPAPLPRRPRRAALRPQPTACSLVGCAGRAPCERASAESPVARDLSLRYSRAAAAPSPRSTTMALTPSFGKGLPASRSEFGTDGLGWSRGPSGPRSARGTLHQGSAARKPVDPSPPPWSSAYEMASVSFGSGEPRDELRKVWPLHISDFQVSFLLDR